jgi:hypothetical protein
MEYDTPYLLSLPVGQLIELPISMVLDDCKPWIVPLLRPV